MPRGCQTRAGSPPHDARIGAGGSMREGSMRHETTRPGRRRPSARRARAAIVVVFGLLLSATIAAPVGAGSPTHDSLVGARLRDVHGHSAGTPARIDATRAARAAAGAPRKARALERLKVPFGAGPATARTKPGKVDLAAPGERCTPSLRRAKVVVPQPAPGHHHQLPGPHGGRSLCMRTARPVDRGQSLVRRPDHQRSRPDHQPRPGRRWPRSRRGPCSPCRPIASTPIPGSSGTAPTHGGSACSPRSPATSARTACASPCPRPPTRPPAG